MHKLLVLLFIFSLFGCSQKKQLTQYDKNINTLFDQYWDERSAYFTIEATQQGDPRFNDRIPNDQTHEFREKLKAFYQTYLDRLLKFKPEELSAQDKLSYETLKLELEVQLEGMKYTSWMIPFHQFWGLPLLMGQLGSGDSFQPFITVKDYENWLGRLKDFSQWADSAILNFREGVKSGYVLPNTLVIKMIPQMQGFVVRDPRKSLFYSPILKMGLSIPKEERKRLSEKYLDVINDHVNPTYKKLARFLKKEYLPHARTSYGISSLTDGKEYYDYLARYWTTTSIKPEVIYDIGLSEVARIRGEMERVKAQVKYEGDLPKFFNHLRTDPKFMPFKTPKEVLDAFYDIHNRMGPQLSLMFNRVPKTPFEIRQTEEFRAATASAEYSQGSPDGSRPGIFYLPILDATKFNLTSGMESLFLHEAIPGHHYQISLQQENSELPKFRRFAWYGSYGEGWALYTESLGKELGLYKDPYQYMGALGDEMHRALRLVVDVGLHTKNMTREEAIKYLLGNEPISEEGAIAEVERYMAIPGQALSYKIGSLRIWELRKKYATQLGEKFNLSQFHDEFLKDGCLPLSVVENKMDAWATSL